MTLKELSDVDKVYFIMIGVSGSWLWDSTYPNCIDEKWCENFVKHFVDTYGWEDEGVQKMIDDYYEEMIEYSNRNE